MQPLFRNFFTVCIMGFFVVACSSHNGNTQKKSTPQTVAQHYMQAVLQGNTNAALQFVHIPTEQKNTQGTNDLLTGKLKLAIQAAQKTAKKKGGVASISTSVPHYLDDKKRAEVIVTIQFKQGEQDKKLVRLLATPKGWKVYYLLDDTYSAPEKSLIDTATQNAPQKNMRTVHTYTQEVTAVTFSPTGKILASASEDGSIQLWNTQTNTAIGTFNQHSKGVNSIAFSPDARFILSGSDDAIVRLWETETGKLIRSFTGHTAFTNTIAYAPNGRWIASGSLDSTVRLWDVKTGKTIHVFKGHSDNVYALAFSPNGQFLATASWDGTTRLWNVQTKELIHQFKGSSGSMTKFMTTVAFSPDSQTIAVGSFDAFVRLWNVKTGALIYKVECPSVINAVAFSPNGQYIAVGTKEDAYILHAKTGKKMHTVDGKPKGVSSVAFSSDKKWLALGGFDATVRLVEVNTLLTANHTQN